MFLGAALNPALKDMITTGPGRGYVTHPEGTRGYKEKTFLLSQTGVCDHFQPADIYFDELRSVSGGTLIICYNKRNRLTHEVYLIPGKKHFIGNNSADIIPAGNVFPGKNLLNTWKRHCSGDVETGYSPVSRGRAKDKAMQAVLQNRYIVKIH